MNTIIKLCDKDIFPKEFLIPEPKEFKNYKDRVKGIILDSDGKICLVKGDNVLLPGGGVEKDESKEDALKREIVEEIGCEIEVIKLLGVSDEYWNKTEGHQNVYCFVAKIMDKIGIPSSQQEDEKNMTIDWYRPQDAIDVLEKQIENNGFKNYHFCFNSRVHLAFLNYFLKEKNDLS